MKKRRNKSPWGPPRPFCLQRCLCQSVRTARFVCLFSGHRAPHLRKDEEELFQRGRQEKTEEGKGGKKKERQCTVVSQPPAQEDPTDDQRSSPTADTDDTPSRPKCEQLISEDPAQWPTILNHTQVCQLNTDKIPRRFKREYYEMTMKNGNKIQQRWLMYSVSTESTFCFACKIFGKLDNSLTKGGFRYRKNIASHLKEHEHSKAHHTNMMSWQELNTRLKTKTAIDQINQNLMHLEVEHWRGVIHRVIAIICYLAERNQALRGHTEALYDPHNGNFLAQMELMAQFDPIMNEHIRKFQTKQTKVHYLSKISEEIARQVKAAKYFSVIMDCTPDTSHTEQLSIVLRVVKREPSVGASISEHFIGFVDVQDTTGRGLSETLLEKLDELNLNIRDCRGQSYDNGSNMMGHKQGVQARLLQLNEKALCVPCSSHTLNLVVADAAKSSVGSISFFGVLPRLYNLFSSSVQRWAVLQEHVKHATVKSLSVTRWEARIDSVKVVRYHLPELIQALSGLQTLSVQKKDSETLSTATSIKAELMTWRFVLCTVIWYNILYQINRVSKILQSPSVSLETLKAETSAVRTYLENARESGLAAAQSDATKIAESLEIDRTFPAKRQRKTTKQFLYEGREESQSTPDEQFKREFFLPLVDTALTSLTDRFSKMEDVFGLYGFLFSKET
ncbi:zinc finger MYM-type protein 1-like [Xyrichtys novacula]|uniref:Zinc finger MYM-type protein 1-like n=1 Tax=Xyrichtys novacula TaxID=13765 RepID=A0AAV1FG56_XYRNO|nr:zinc finger MYM-type protein 1-like [Xyrichtys novacula]